MEEPVIATPTRKGTVYLITNIVNGKRYVGQTMKSLSARWAQHKWSAAHHSQSAIHRAIRKYGASNFTIRPLEEGCEDLNLSEIRCIQEQGSAVPAGYNLTLGGEGSNFSIPEVRERHLLSVRQRSKNQDWIENTKLAAKRRAADSGWIASHKANVSGESWRAAHQKGITAAFGDPVFRGWNSSRVRTQHASGLLHKLSPEARALGRARSLETRAKKLAERDALLSPGELARKLIRRASDRIRRAKRGNP